MVNWHDPTILQDDHFIFIKLTHAIAGIYIWEIVFTTGFELDVLRRKRPYKWTIWLYLGTRYALLFAFILLMVYMSAPRLPCKPLIIVFFTLIYVSWAFASFIIVLRINAIWNRNTIVSLTAVGVLLSGLALNIRHLTIVAISYTHDCIIPNKHSVVMVVNVIGILVVDVVLLLTMLIGLLRHQDRNSIGILKLLYNQCIIWLALAFFAEIPPVTFLILNLNAIMDEIFIPPGMAILCIGAARMYRTLCDRGSLTEYVSPGPTQFSSQSPNSTVQSGGANGNDSMHFASATQSEGTRTSYETPVIPPADQIYTEFVPGGSIPSLTLENTKDRIDSAGYKAV